MPTNIVHIRSRFWPRFLRWAVGFQFGWALFIAVGVAVRVLDGDGLPPIELVPGWGFVSGVLALLALFIAYRRRNLGCAEITPRGVRTLSPRMFHSWACLGTIRVKAGPLGNRWLEVMPDYAPPFKLTAHPTDPAAVLDALERFAGEHHPLTRAYATLLDMA